MTCENVEEKLVDYLEETLPRRDHEQVKSHIGGCRDCEDRHAAWVQFLVDIKQQEIPDPGIGFWQEFTARVKYAVEQEQVIRQSTEKAWWKIDLSIPAFQWASASAVVVIALGIFLSQWPRHFSSNRPTLSPLQQAVRQADLSDQEGAEIFFDLMDEEGDDQEGDFMMIGDKV
jgi:anti-sigma factor RsiW